MYEFLDRVASYTELLRENRLGDVDCSGDKKIWRIVTPRLLYKPCKISPSLLSHSINDLLCLLLHNNNYWFSIA